MEEMNQSKAVNKTKDKWRIILIATSVLLLIGNIYLLTVLKSSSDDKSDLIGQLGTSQQQLEIAQQKNLEYEEMLQDYWNEQRVADLTAFVKETNRYKADTGSYPTTEPNLAQPFWNDYVLKNNPNFNEPSTGEQYVFTPVATVQTPPMLEVGVIQYQWPGGCTDSGDFEDVSDESRAASRILLSNDKIYCLES